MPPQGYEPFLDLILDNPSDDGPRLVYADWLEEHGDARGEFIRVQVELARLPQRDPNWHRLVDRETALLLTHGEDWRTDVPQWARNGCEFRRGFITEVQLFIPWERHFGPELSRAAPVEKVTLHRAHLFLQEFAAGPDLRHLHDLAILDSEMDQNDLRVLCNSASAIGPLRSLLFLGMDLTDTGAHIISLCHHLTHLERLELKRCSIGNRGVERLGRSVNPLHKLGWLDLSDNELGDSIWLLLESPRMPCLTRLHWNDNQLTNVGCRLLADSNNYIRLKHLELAGNNIGDAGARILLARFPDLQFLDLSRNPLTLGVMNDLWRHYGERVRLELR